MTLAIDIGNSNVTFGLYPRGATVPEQVWRLPTKSDGESAVFYHLQLSNALLERSISAAEVGQVVLSTVVPDLRTVFTALCSRLFFKPPLWVDAEIYPRLKLRIDRPDELGTDLYSNAVAAYYRYGQDCIVVDFGTALTFTVINAEGQLLGVSIAPGLKTAIGALFQKTAQLPEVPLELPPSAVGTNTVSAIQSGVLLGYIGLVRHMLAAIRAELGGQYIAIATGGLSAILHPLSDDFHEVAPNLTLDGLRIIAAEAAEG